MPDTLELPEVKPSKAGPVPVSEDNRPLGPGKFPGLWHPIRTVFWLIHVAFGTAAIVLVLSILAAIPALNCWFSDT